MSYFLQVDDKEADAKINIDELYERAQQQDLKQLSIFKKILNRIHTRIKKVAQSKVSDKHIFFHVPEYIFGEPLYDKGDCIAFLVHQLKENKFHVRYIHPNTLLISWSHWIPAYVRAEFKRKTGKILDEFGNITDPAAEEAAAAAQDTNSVAAENAAAAAEQRRAKNFRPPSFIYGDVLEKIDQRWRGGDEN